MSELSIAKKTIGHTTLINEAQKTLASIDSTIEKQIQENQKILKELNKSRPTPQRIGRLSQTTTKETYTALAYSVARANALLLEVPF